MAFTNYESKEINCKVVYFGAPGAGKTTNLRSIFSDTSSEVQSGLLEFDDVVAPTRYFDFLPISLGYIQDFHVKMHLYTLPNNTLYETTRSVILKGMDGYVFVADSSMEAMINNLDAHQQTQSILRHEGIEPLEIPRVFQYNKRDLADAVPVGVLRRELNVHGAPDIECIAKNSQGTLETLQQMAKLILQGMGQ